MELEAIPGVGSKTATALSELDDPERALRTGDVAELASAPGITEGRAAAIARGAIRERHDDPGGFLATDRAKELYRDALGLLKDRTVTSYGEKRLETLYPSGVESRIEEVREFAERALERDPDPEVLDALADVEPLAEPRDVSVRDRCLATADAERYSEAQRAIPELTVEVVEDARDLADLARGYSTVIALDEAFAGVAVDGDVRVEPDALERPAEVVPERVLAFYASNRECLQAAARVHRAAGIDPPLDLEALESALERVDSEGTVVGDDELDRLARAIDDLDAAVSTAESVANDALRTAIEEQDVTVEGSDLLSLVEQGAGVDSLLSRELSDEHAEAVAQAREELIESLDLDSGEAEVARRAFPEEPTFPVERDEEVVTRLREDLQAAKDRRAARRKRELAADLADRRDDAERLVRTALELDVELAIARFAADFDCVMPEFDSEPSESGDSTRSSSSRGACGFDISGGRSPLLDVAFEAVEPVDYDVSGVALLSGVNSGGKTSTLDLVALVTILAHMGLPVPAESVRIQRFGELHYHAKTQGTLDAGAFEATLREFAGLATGGTRTSSKDADAGGNRLVLVDELESITEPGASAKIIAGILEELRGRDVTGVFVSHLAAEIREMADYDVSVDGIEAQGLEDGELVVNRSPVKNHLARSTPELIVEKLAGDSSGEFYDRLLEKF
ncbi:helix-hairpin-helix domain-containing protein [Halorussus sp. MSC15.2]|uniref:helix-hairpin-helix domain-containing protein n=1 Tax=Halorussus sp. MSC15.2 TaxID=2283638 RepID=UPI0013D35549|nr:helix-hairpin-helix domain-containing protein [Halorussus sp. MSC15.2]NEU55374.1 endonuclease MutS2 [Halorussus sp. MSC15.2]